MLADSVITSLKKRHINAKWRELDYQKPNYHLRINGEPISLFITVTKDLICTSLGFRTMFLLNVQLGLVLNEQAKELFGIDCLLLNKPVGQSVENVNVLGKQTLGPVVCGIY
jgi:hypothetical protein